jgi:hypothetical protein
MNEKSTSSRKHATKRGPFFDKAMAMDVDTDEAVSISEDAAHATHAVGTTHAIRTAPPS